jgi:RNA polymerase sigma-70 factor, ECF subfamily
VGTGGRGGAGGGEGALDERALVADVGQRRHEALGEIYRRHGGAVWSIANRVCASPALAEDVCETVFTELWSWPERFDAARGSLRSQLVAAAHARAVALGRRAEPDAPVAAAPAPAVDHADGLDAATREALDQLAPVERDALLLCYIGGHPVGEAARRLALPEAEVKSSIRRGLLNLRKALDAEGVSR